MQGSSVAAFLALVAIISILALNAVFLGLLWRDSRDRSGDYYVDVAMGRRAGARAVTIAGRNPSVASDNNEDLWDGGGDFPPPLAFPQAVEVASNSPEDTEGGIGARRVTLEGVGAGYRAVKETVTLAGEEAVVTTQKFLAINAFYVSASGSYGVNRDQVTAVAREARTQMAVISPTLARSLAARYTVPAGETLLVHNLVANINQPGDEPITTAFFMLWVRDAEEGGNLKPYFLSGVQASGDGHIARTFQPPLRVPATSDIYMSVSVSATDVDVSAYIDAVATTNK